MQDDERASDLCVMPLNWLVPVCVCARISKKTPYCLSLTKLSQGPQKAWLGSRELALSFFYFFYLSFRLSSCPSVCLREEESVVTCLNLLHFEHTAFVTLSTSQTRIRRLKLWSFCCNLDQTARLACNSAIEPLNNRFYAPLRSTLWDATSVPAGISFVVYFLLAFPPEETMS